MNILYISLFQELYELYFKSSKFENYLFQYHKDIIIVFNNSFNFSMCSSFSNLYVYFVIYMLCLCCHAVVLSFLFVC